MSRKRDRYPYGFGPDGTARGAGGKRGGYDFSELARTFRQLDRDALAPLIGPAAADRYGAALARAERVLDDFARRTPEAKAAAKRARRRRLRAAAIRARRAAFAVLAVFAAYVIYSFAVSPLGLIGFVAACIVATAAAVLVALLPVRQLPDRVSDATPAAQLVERLDVMLHERRAALPAPAAREADAISAQLPLLEQRLAALDPLDPLAADARRLVGNHIPELLQRYDAIPAEARRSAEVEARLVAGLDAARQAVGDVVDRLAQGDLDALDTHGRFLESKYKDPSLR